MNQYVVFKTNGTYEVVSADTIQQAAGSMDEMDHITRFYPDIDGTVEKLVRSFSYKTGWKLSA